MDLEDFLEKEDAETNSTPKGDRPDLRLVQSQRQQDGSEKLVDVGAMWKNVSKQGNEFYSVRIGNLRLLAFPNNNK